jgi:hypothetical protein
MLLGIALLDLREALDRLNQGPGNSSRPSGSLAPFERGQSGKIGEDEGPGESGDAPPAPVVGEAPRETPEEQESAEALSAEESSAPSPPEKKRPGRQVGMTGHSRNLVLPVTAEVEHLPTACIVCGSALPPEDFVAMGGHYVLDLDRTDTVLGLTVTHVKHRDGTLICPCCGHTNDSTPERVADDPKGQAGLSPWHRVGPHRASLIVFLPVRMHGSYARIREFLHPWLGIDISTATLNRTVQERGRALAPLEDELVRDIPQAALLHIAETGHLEDGKLLWLGVFICTNTCLYPIGHRSAEFLDTLLMGVFHGCLMSDGYAAYRRFLNRLRC